MEVEGRHYRTIWLADDGRSVEIIDQTRLPHAFVVARLATVEEAADAIRRMRVRGAPLIGAAAAYGMALAASTDAADPALDAARSLLLSTRPTAINLRWALDEVLTVLRQLPPRRRAAAAWRRAAEICDEDVAINSAIGDNGLPLIERAWQAKARRQCVNVLTHCKCRLAGHRRLGDRARARLQGARSRHSRARLGRRDAAAQPGRLPYGLGTRPPRRAAHRDCR